MKLTDSVDFLHRDISALLPGHELTLLLRNLDALCPRHGLALLDGLYAAASRLGLAGSLGLKCRRNCGN